MHTISTFSRSSPFHISEKVQKRFFHPFIRKIYKNLSTSLLFLKNPLENKIVQLTDIKMLKIQSLSDKLFQEKIFIQNLKQSINKFDFKYLDQIKELNIKNEEILADLFIYAVNTNLCYISYIEKFNIQNQKILADLAQFSAKKNGFITANSIHKFHLQNEIDRYLVLAICIEKQPYIISSIHDFMIQDETLFIQIAKNLAQISVKALIDSIQKFPINSEKGLAEILHLSIQKDFKLTFQSKKLFKIENWELFIHECKFSKDHADELLKLYQHLKSSSLFYHSPLEEIFVDCLFYLSKESSKSIDWILETKFLSHLLNLKSRTLKKSLVSVLFKFANHKDMQELWIDFFQSDSKDPSDFKLMIIQLANIASKDNEQTFYIKIAKTIKDSIPKRKSKFHDGKNRILLLELFCLIYHHLDQQIEIRLAFKRIFNDFFIDGNEQDLFLNVIYAKRFLEMNNFSWIYSRVDLKLLLSKNISQLIPIDWNHPFNKTQYEKIFENSRQPGALFSYANTLQTLNEQAVLTSLTDFVLKVLNGTFKDSRYLFDNPHLAKIENLSPSLVEMWKENDQIYYCKNQESKSYFIYKEKENCLISVLVEHPLVKLHSNINYLSEYLKSSDKKSSKSKLSERLKRKVENRKKIDVDQDFEINSLKIQLQAIYLIESKLGEKKKSLEAILKFTKSIHSISKDIDQLLTHLNESLKQEKESLIVHFTDDPIDLLLLGTDVDDSCLHVNGKANLNKGLLGYIMDGKIKALVIKNMDGKIVSRTLLKLLLEGDKPVVYQDFYYPKRLSNHEQEALDYAAKEIAKKLNLPLRKITEFNLTSWKPLLSLGSAAPYEYNDAKKCVEKFGVYQI